MDIETQVSKKYGISREDLIRAIEREIKLMESKGSGGRKNRVKLVEAEFVKRHFISPINAEVPQRGEKTYIYYFFLEITEKS